jgi:glycosyltransferase involved in cell wall biosynthesis
VGERFWPILSGATLLTTISLAAIVIRGQRKIRKLIDSPPELPAGNTTWPGVTIIVAARNEETHVAAAVKSLLAQDYDDFEVLVVNDRSTDHTGAILHELAKREGRLTVVDVTDLPAGWLGKNHALHLGSQKARGDLLLFADADVSMTPEVLKRAVAFLCREKLDHLPIVPDILMPHWFLDSFALTFFMCFNSYFRPWKASDPKSKCYVGVGAFNMVRASVLKRLGGLERIKMRPDDDVMLGRLVKHNGFRQELLYGGDLLSVPWYPSIRETINGLMKNAFSALNYNPWLLMGSSLVAVINLVLPFFAIWFVGGFARWIYFASIIAIMVMMIDEAILARRRWWVVLAFPLTILLLVYIQWRAMILTYWQDGIVWRGTHYPLAELRKNGVEVNEPV